ncbi:MAG: MTH1187 family thiamine-binding protein [Desulfobacterales bacterium]|nr:MTH1187 family thiamine-binding protein [Desulfobacterales bacterium]
MSVIIDLAVFPMDKGTSLSPYVAEMVNIIKKSNLPYKFGPMGTSIEGEWNEVMALVNQCFEGLKKDCDRIYMTIKADYRKGVSGRIEGKLKSVENKLGE